MSSTKPYLTAKTMVLALLYGLCCMALSTGAAAAAKKDVLTGVWKGAYACGGARGKLTLVVDPGGDRFIIETSGGSSEEYKLRSGYVPKEKRYRANVVEWGTMTSDGFKVTSLEATLADDGHSLRAVLKGCKPSDLAKTDKEAPSPLVVAKPAPPKETVKVPTERYVAERAARGFVGIWEGETTACLKGPIDVRVEFGALDAEGFDARVWVRSRGEASPWELRARTRDARSSDEIIVLAEPAPTSRNLRGAFEMQLEMQYGGKTLSGRSRSPDCGLVRLSKSTRKSTTNGEIAQVPERYRGLEGDWDGAIYDHRDSKARQLALSIRASTSGVTDRIFDAALTVDGEQQKAGIFAFEDKLSLVSEVDQGLAGAPVGGSISALIRDGGGRELLTASLSGSGHGFSYLWRRPAGRSTALQAICGSDVGDWIKARAQARRLARTLKVEFYPALTDYDIERASLNEAVWAMSSTGSADDTLEFASILYECALTAPALVAQDEELLGGFVSAPDIAKQRAALSRGFYPEHAKLLKVRPSIQPNVIRKEMEAGEQKVPELVRGAENLKSVDDLLDHLKANLVTWQNARPRIVAELLRPIETNLSRAVVSEAALHADERKTGALRMMKGVAIPRALFPSGREDLLYAVMAGSLEQLTRDEIGFLAGMVAESIGKCSKPPAATSIQLVELLKQGFQLSLGSDYMGNVPSMMKSMFAGSANFQQGVDFAKSLGCNDRFLDAIFEILADLQTSRSRMAAERPPLFVRSCALDRAANECTCIMNVLQTVMPGISQEEYSSAPMRTAMEMNPIYGIELMTRCGVSRY